MIKAIIFDSDGMLSHGPRFSDTYAKEHGIPIEELTPFFVGPFKNCLVGKSDLKEELQNGWLQKWEWKDSVEEFLGYWFSVGDRLDEEVFATVKEFRNQGITCVLATNQEKYRTEYLSNKFGYHTVFDKVFSSAYVGHKKPNREFFEEAFSYLKERNPQITKDEVLFWDDDQENVDGAAAFGIKAERYTDSASYRKKMEEYTSEVTDEELAVQVQTGNEVALATLIDRYEPKLLRYGQRFLGNQNENVLREAVQDVFIAVYQNIEGFDTKQRFSPWIYRIAHNAFVDVLRQKTRQLMYGFDFDKIFSHPAYAHTEDPYTREKENAEMRVLLEKGLDSLSVQQREIIVLYYFEELSYKEIADVLHIPVSTVGVRLTRARAALKKHLPNHTYD